MCDHIKECRERFNKVDAALSDLTNRLFIGNGTTPLLTRIDRLERVKSILVWLVGPLYIMATGVVGKMVYDVFAK